MARFPLHIAIYAGGSVSFTGKTPQQRDLGGSEYATVCIAEALAKRGHTMVVFTPDNKSVYGDAVDVVVNDVHYCARERSWKEVNHATQWDVFIASRDYSILSNTTITAKLMGLWNHDILTDPDGFREHCHRLDFMWCLSEYHKQQYLRALTDPHTQQCTLKPEHIGLTRNGIDLSLITKTLQHIKDHELANGWRVAPDGKYADPTFLYCSRPERGLFYLLRDIWPHVLTYMPNAKLKLAFYDVDSEQLPPHIAAIHQDVYRLLRTTPRVDFCGALPRSALFQVMAASHGLLYSAIFPETSCLTALEAQALGTPALTSNRGALPEINWTDSHVIFNWERVEAGDKDHSVSCAEWIADFILNYWEDGEVNERAAVQSTIHEAYNWDSIAEEWEQSFFDHFSLRSTIKAKRIIQNLVYHSDLLAVDYALKNSLTIQDGNFTTDLLSPKDRESVTEDIANYLTYHHAEPELYAEQCGDGHEDILLCPDRMKIALDLIEHHFGHEKPFRLLDIGVGSGRFLYHVLRNFHNCQVMGFDFSLELCVQARKNITDAFPALAEDISFIQHCDVLSIPPPDSGMQADVVFCGEFLEHQTEIVQALTVVDSWCKEGGLVIYTTPYGPWEAISFGEAKTSDGHEIRFHVSHFEHRDFEEMFREVEYRLQAAYIQHSPLDSSVIGNYVLSYIKNLHWHGKECASGNLLADAEQTKFYTPDYHRKFLTTRPYIRVGGFIIAKDEEDNITRALKPIKGRLDALVVYDTGSIDKTIELARSYANEVIEGYWDDDFGAARNRALDALMKYDVDWLYWQDFDEQLTHAFRMRFYLRGDLGIFQGNIILQQHLMADSPMTQDIPIRLFRNIPEYRFLGHIHEHVLDCTDPNGNTNLFPLMILPDVKILHYGYATEDERRWKAIHRNYALLKEDRQAYPNREMGKLFLMRDYLHEVKWSHLEKQQPLTTKHIALLHDIIEKYEEFADPYRQNHVLARFFYQQALEILGNAHVAGPDGTVPIHAVVMLGGLHGPLPAPVGQPELRWFVNPAEFAQYVQRETSKLCERLDKKRHVFED